MTHRQCIGRRVNTKDAQSWTWTYALDTMVTNSQPLCNGRQVNSGETQ